MNADTGVRLAIYERFIDEGEPPSPEDIADALDISVEDAKAAFRRLADARVIVLMPGTDEIWMANPLSAVPTSFGVETPQGSFWGNCIWDGLGVVSMLGGEGTVETRCADCNGAISLQVKNGQLIDGDGVAHFAVPAARWWENIGFT
jgi:Alkylmercury lyase